LKFKKRQSAVHGKKIQGKGGESLFEFGEGEETEPQGDCRPAPLIGEKYQRKFQIKARINARGRKKRRRIMFDP